MKMEIPLTRCYHAEARNAADLKAENPTFRTPFQLVSPTWFMRHHIQVLQHEAVVLIKITDVLDTFFTVDGDQVC